MVKILDLKQFQPKTKTDIIGNKTSVLKLEECIKNKRPAIIYGPPGVGKTSSVYALANDLNFQVQELNASDERTEKKSQNFLNQIQTKTFFPTLFLLDEIDGAENFGFIDKCIKYTCHPLILTCNEFHKIPKTTQQLCEQIRFYNPRITEVTKYIEKIEKKLNIKADYTGVSNDIRNSLLCAFNHGKKYSHENDFETIQKFFQTSTTKQLNPNHYLWLLDNGYKCYKGKKLYLFHQLLALSDQTGRFEQLSIITPSNGYIQIEFPRFITKRKTFRSKN